MLQHPAIDINAQAARFGDVEEVIGRAQAAGRVLPTDQSHEADDAPIFEPDEGLMEQDHLIAGDEGLCQLTLQADLVYRVLVAPIGGG